MTERRTRGNLWLLLAILPLVSVSCWFCLRDDDSVAPTPASPEPSPPALTPTVSVEPPPIVVREAPDAGHDAGSDAGTPDAGSDAGTTSAPRTKEPSEAEVAAYIARWRRALEPVMRVGGPKEPRALTASATLPDLSDAGCEPGRHTLSMAGRKPVDLVVAVDTSGSMFSAGLDIAADFIGRLEHRLVELDLDYQLLVLAEPRYLKLTTDAGVSRTAIGSSDGLDVLLDTATQYAPFWLQLVRPDVPLRMVLVTDDGPWPQVTEAGFLAHIQRTLPSREVRFDIVGGFDVPPGTPLLTPTSPLARATCSSRFNGRSMVGRDIGVVYQDVATATGGARASICSDASRAELIEVLTTTEEATRCAFPIHPRMHVRDAVATDARGGALYLVNEPSFSQCPGLRRSYVRLSTMLVLCPDTCADLSQRQTRELNLEVDCR